ncbi:MAG: ArnT family glycosyltransferase [Candidatus Woesearchaeota archaeon]
MTSKNYAETKKILHSTNRKHSNKLHTFYTENKGIVFLLGIFFIIKTLFITIRYHLPIWDEGVYIGMGKYIYSSGNSGLWEIIRPPALPLINGLLWKIGLDPLIWGQVVAIIFSCALLFIVYIIAKEIFDKKIAFTSALLLAITPLFFLYSIYILTDIPSTIFTLLAIYFCIKNKYFLAGLSVGIAILFRFPQGLILLPIGIAILIDSFDLNNSLRFSKNSLKFSKIKNSIKDVILKSLKILLGCIIVIIPYIIANYLFYRKYTGNLTDAIFRPFILAAPHGNNIYGSVIDSTFISHVYNIFYYLIALLKNNPTYIFLIVGLIYLIYEILRAYNSKNSRATNSKMSAYAFSDVKRSKIILISFIIYITYFTYIISKEERYMMPFLPFACIITAYGIFRTVDYFKSSKTIKSSKTSKKRGTGLFLIIFFIVASSLYSIGLDATYYNWMYERDKKPDVVEKYYLTIDKLNISGTILTTDRVLSAYTDNKIATYYVLNNDLIIANEWETNDKIGAVAYSYKTIPCIVNDDECVKKRDELLAHVSEKYLKYSEGEFYGTKMYIFLPRE